jgi:tetratricopeptide (TPR) repeat protein
MAATMPQAAQKSFTSAAQEYPQVFSHTGLASAYQAQKRWDLAAREWEQVLQSRGEILQDGYPPDLADAHLQLARAYREMKNLDLARNHFGEVLRMGQHADELPLFKNAERELQELTLQSLPR